MLSILAKFASGYWNLVDPTNGYGRSTRACSPPFRGIRSPIRISSRFRCCANWDCGGFRYWNSTCRRFITVRRVRCSIAKVLWEFPPRLLRLTLRRILLQYFVFDVNLASLYLAFGMLLLLGGGAWGAYQWIVSSITHVSRSTGTVMLAVLPFLMGFQLVLNALMVDVQFAQKTDRLTRI